MTAKGIYAEYTTRWYLNFTLGSFQKLKSGYRKFVFVVCFGGQVEGYMRDVDLVSNI